VNGGPPDKNAYGEQKQEVERTVGAKGSH
jgi:hypothetical protein